MPRTDEEVFARFRDDPELTREQAHLAYAAYAEAKYDWFEHMRKLTGSAPSPKQIEDWIAALPESRFKELRLTSFTFFEEAAEAYMQEQIEAAKREAVDGSILDEVRRLNRDLSERVQAATSTSLAWKIGIGAGVFASLLFTLIVALGNWIFTSDPSPFALIKALMNHGAPPPGPGTTRVSRTCPASNIETTIQRRGAVSRLEGTTPSADPAPSHSNLDAPPPP